MKRVLTITLYLLVSAGVLFAQSRLDAAAPKDARTMAMGGAFVAMSDGYQSFYGNPAAFAQKEKELTLFSVTPWMYVRPTTDNIDMVTELTTAMSSGGNETEMIGPFNDLIVDNGFGLGGSAGLGWIGRGLGLGLIGSGEMYVGGKNLLGAAGTVDSQVAGIVGIGVPLRIGKLAILLGGDVRPYLRMNGTIVGSDLLGIMSGGDLMVLPVNVGFGLAVDLGARIDIGSLLSLGLAIRDISTKQTFAQSTIGEVLKSDGLPVGTQVEYPVYPNVTVGASFSPLPVSIRPIMDLTLIAEIQDPVKVFQEKSSAWNLFHVGAEAEMLGGLLALRAGLNKGWISLGAGLDLFVMEFNVAVFTEELGPRPGDRPRTGISAEMAIRF